MRSISFKNNLMFMAFVLLMGVSQLAFAGKDKKTPPSEDDQKQTVSKKRPIVELEDAEESPFPENMKCLLEMLKKDSKEDIAWLEKSLKDPDPKKREEDINYFFAMQREGGNDLIAYVYQDGFLIASNEY